MAYIHRYMYAMGKTMKLHVPAKTRRRAIDFTYIHIHVCMHTSHTNIYIHTYFQCVS